MNRRNLSFMEGNLTKDPVLALLNRTDKDGNNQEVSVCNFTLAINGGRDGNSDEVYFAHCELWDTAAKAMAEYRKGDCIRVEGNMKTKKWVDKKTNEERSKDVLRVSHFSPCYVREREPINS